jgi:hypothetical protein
MMPTYRFINNDTGEEFEDFMTISDLDEYLKSNQNITQLVNGAPLIHSGRGLGKPDNGFRDLLKDIKRRNSRGITRSTVNTF